jgi:hypothetical protein
VLLDVLPDQSDVLGSACFGNFRESDQNVVSSDQPRHVSVTPVLSDQFSWRRPLLSSVLSVRVRLPASFRRLGRDRKIIPWTRIVTDPHFGLIFYRTSSERGLSSLGLRMTLRFPGIVGALIENSLTSISTKLNKLFSL